jgi:PAT family acetyl-CoA transporter-like MFS transporter 1
LHSHTHTDIAVDAWALVLLQRRNVGYAATTNSVGQSAGKFIGFIILLVFESKEFCNDYIFTEPRETGLFTLSEFLFFWAIVYIIITSLVALFKYECSGNVEQLEQHPDYGIKKAYPILLEILRLKPVIKLYTMLFTVEATFAAFDSVTNLKLIEYGVPKDKYALLSIPSAPVQIFIPLLITKYTTGERPLSFYYRLFPFRIVLMIATASFVYFTRTLLDMQSLVMYFYIAVIILFMAEQVKNFEFI